MSTLAQGAIKSLPIVLPPLQEQRDILKFVDAESRPLAISIGSLEREIELLREYRARLISELVTGKLDVREAAAYLPDEITPVVAECLVDELEDAQLIDEEAEA